MMADCPYENPIGVYTYIKIPIGLCIALLIGLIALSIGLSKMRVFMAFPCEHTRAPGQGGGVGMLLHREGFAP